MRAKRILIVVLTLVVAWCGLSVEPAFADKDYDLPYFIDVDITNQIVTIYNTADGSVARQMLCSTGTVGHETPTGVYYLPANTRDDERSEWYSFYALGVYAKWATRIINGYLFHSFPCSRKSLERVSQSAVKQFGMPASHGCVRLRVEDAEFIAKKCLKGTRVTIYESGELDEDLRKLLYISSYTGEDGMTYREFLGYSETDLGRGSSGAEVLDLQYRLSDLGYYEGEPNGAYDTKTIAAVKHLQDDLGLADNGIASESLLQVIYSDAAPISAGEVTLEEGKSGPVVKKLQTALATLGVYNGAIDSILDLDVTEAVKKFQQACGYETDGVLTPEIQQAIYYVVNQLETSFGADSIPQAELVTEEIQLATVNAKANLIIRSQPDTKSDAKGKAYIGDTVMVVGTDGDWANVVAGKVSGYMYTKYLKKSGVDYNYILRYTGADGTSYSIGATLEERLNGAKDFADVFSALYTSEQFTSYAEETVEYATVTTGSDDVRLNLRAEPSSEADILEQVPNGTNLRVLAQEGDWTKVGYEEAIGYLMNQYLSFWEGSVADLEEEVEESSVSLYDLAVYEMDVEIPATVVSPTVDGKKVKPYLYEETSKKADKISVLEVGAEVTIVKFFDDANSDYNWVQINYLGGTGYMLDICLKYQIEGA